MQKAERLHEELREENLRLNRENQTLRASQNFQYKSRRTAEERLAQLSGADQLQQENERLKRDLLELQRHPGSPGMGDSRRLANWLQQLDNGIVALLGSRRWQIGNASGKALGAILRRPENKTAAGHLQRVLGEYRDWKSERDKDPNG